MRRVLRIFPLYYGALAGTLLLIHSHVRPLVILLYGLNLSNLVSAFDPYCMPYLTHFWSLAIEEQFYLVLPAVVRRVSGQALAWIFTGVIIGSLLLRNLPVVLQMNARWPDLVYRLTPFRVDTLCGGALLALVVQRRPDLVKHRVHLRLALFAFGGIFLVTSLHSTWLIRFGYTSLMLCFTSLIALALSPEGLTARVFSGRFLRATGRYSYCFYVIHIFVLSFAFFHRPFLYRAIGRLHLSWVPDNLVWLAVGVLCFAVLFGISALSWRFYESPILQLKRHFVYRWIEKA